VKDYPKDRAHRRIKLAPHISDQLQARITEHRLGPDDLLLTPTLLLAPVDPSYLQLVTDAVDLGLTEPNAAGRRYRHGSLTGYHSGGCKCAHCRGACATYRIERRAVGKDRHPAPRTTRSRTLTTDGHNSRPWFREHIWKPALDTAGIGICVRTHDKHHDSWLLACGANLQTVEERLDHGSVITTEKYLHTLAEADDTGPRHHPTTAPTALARPRRAGADRRAPSASARRGVETSCINSSITAPTQARTACRAERRRIERPSDTDSQSVVTVVVTTGCGSHFGQPKSKAQRACRSD
jgi:hypothetical protein